MLTMLRNARWAAAVLLALAAAGAGAQQGQAASDENLAATLADKLDASPRLDDTRIEVSVVDGTVVLTGTVTRLSQAWWAETLAAQLEGARAVDDRLKVDPRDLPDEALRAEVESRLGQDPDLARAGLGVHVRNGKVVLTGEVSDARLRLQALDLAAEVPGVTSVEQEIATPPATDAELEREVQGLLGPGSLVRMPSGISVSVRDGVVTVSGTVRMLFERRMVERRILGINGVRGVVNEIRVRP